MAKRSADRPRTQFRSLDGIVLLDKPGGMSSNQALQRVRHLIRAQKGGHTGALDPLATGLLPLCFGEATKIAGLLLGASKAYRTVARLGITTDTDDADGRPLLQRSIEHVNSAAIEALLPQFIGNIRQRPPAYSALKRDGEPLYVKARRGEVIEIAERGAEVFSLRLEHFSGDKFELDIECASGTYVRSLVRDLGECLGCGAHVEQLRREWVAPFHAPKMFTLEQITELAAAGDTAIGECLLPIDAGLIGMPRIELDAPQSSRLQQGQRFSVVAEAGLALALDPTGRPLGLVDVEADGMLRIRRLFVAAAG
ncbi:MAG: tRNA pseudouridine(55) synthase TruB [Pseudomarimonas sp.]